MRNSLLLAALAALVCSAVAGPYRGEAGCHKSDTIRSYRIVRFTFEDIVKGQFVKQAYVQAKSRMRAVAQTNTPALHTECEFDGVMPIKGCFNSVNPGRLGPKQIAGQYGFKANIQYICPSDIIGYTAVVVPCKARLNTLRENRLLAPAFWVGPDGRDKDIVCGDPVTSELPWWGAKSV